MIKWSSKEKILLILLNKGLAKELFYQLNDFNLYTNIWNKNPILNKLI